MSAGILPVEMFAGFQPAESRRVAMSKSRLLLAGVLAGIGIFVSYAIGSIRSMIGRVLFVAILGFANTDFPLHAGY